MSSEEFDVEDRLDLRALAFRIWLGRWWIIASCACFGVGAVIIATVTTPVYRVTTVMVPARVQEGMGEMLNSALGALGGLAALAGTGMVGGTEAATEEALAVLRSRQFTEEFIADKQLMPKLFADRWNAARGKWKVPEKSQPTLANAYKYFDRRIRAVSRDRKTGLVTLRIDWTDRKEATEWANELVERLNAEMRRRAIANAEASVGFLERELESTTVVGTRDAINRLIEAQIKQRMLASVTREYAFRIVDKAMIPDESDPVRPQKKLIVASGVVLGGMLGGLAVLLFRPAPGIRDAVRRKASTGTHAQ